MKNAVLKRNLVALILTVALLATIVLNTPVVFADDPEVVFPDANLESVIRETIQKNHKGIQILSNTYSIRSNKAVVNELEKADGIIRASIALLDEEIQEAGRR